MNAGFALPLLSFITWPLRKFSAATLPALKSAAGPVQDADARIGGRQVVGEPPGSVRRIVVDDQHVGVTGLFVNGSNERFQVVALVIRRQRDEQPERRIAIRQPVWFLH